MAIEINGIPVPEGTDTISAEALQAMVTALTEFPESGSNDDGSFLKFDDGTLIVWDNYLEEVQGVEQPPGIFSKRGNARSYPVKFVGYNPSLQFNYQASETIGVGVRLNSLTGYQPSFYMVSGALFQSYVFMLAIGRWKV